MEFIIKRWTLWRTRENKRRYRKNTISVFPVAKTETIKKQNNADEAMIKISAVKGLADGRKIK